MTWTKKKAKEYGKNWCKENKEKQKEYHKKYYKDNKEYFKEYEKQRQLNPKRIEYNKEYFKKYSQDNKEEISKQQKKYREENKDSISEKAKKYFQKNKEEISKQQKKYCQENKKKVKEYGKIYRQENKEYFKEYYNKYLRERKKTDINFRIRCYLGTRLYQALNKYTKTGKIMSSKQYGIDYKAIIEHLKPFPENIKEYHIDHSKALCKFNFVNKDGSTNLEEVKKAFAPSNHQFLTIQENLSKGGR